MADSIEDKLESTGHKIAEAATHVGHKVEETVEKASDWAKEKGNEVGHRVGEAAQKVEHKTGADLTGSSASSGIREHMDVYASCGTKVGRVDHVEGETIKLTRNDSPDGMHHTIPLSWVTKVHDHIHLSKDHKEVESRWMPA